ncbi:MAG: hypothetical protein PHW56_03585 [Methanosarcinaceae archaeon]|nr:hypothetical protein [Methanosarcinaceae archaeon]
MHMKSGKSITIKDSVIVGGKNSCAEGLEDMQSDMEEAREGLELLRKLKSIKREDAAGYRQIDNEAKLAEAKIEILKKEAEKGDERREGELAALDISRTLNELRAQCVAEEVFTVKVTVEVLMKKVKDEKALSHLENINKMLDAVYDDPFRKLEGTHQTRVLELCNYIEEAYFADVINKGQK